MVDRGRVDVDWAALDHAYGSAVDVPGWIAGLRGPDADECIDDLYGAIVHQGTRYSATAAAIPALVDAVLDPSVAVRVDVALLVKFCATGETGDELRWDAQRALQSDRAARAAWGRGRRRGAAPACPAGGRRPACSPCRARRAGMDR